MERVSSPVLSAPATDAGGAQAGVGANGPASCRANGGAGRGAGRTDPAGAAKGSSDCARDPASPAPHPAHRPRRQLRSRGVALLGCLVVIAVERSAACSGPSSSNAAPAIPLAVMHHATPVVIMQAL